MRQGCKFIDLDGASAIICGQEPTDHKCNGDASIIDLSSGERLPGTDENYKKHADNIVGGSVACSICGRAAIDNAMRDSFNF